MRHDLVGCLAENAGAGDGELAHHRIKLALVADRAAQPAVLLQMARRMRHHPEDVGIAVLAQEFARAVVGLGGIGVVDAGHDLP